MEIIGDRKFVEVPGGKTHELPPLLVNAAPKVNRLDRVMDMATSIVESEDMLAEGVGPETDFGRRRMDLAVNLVEQYLNLVSHWQWGDSIVEWIRQCQMTFESRVELRHLLRAEVWPHAGRSSFVQLLADKAVNTHGVLLERAVGLRLAFRQKPPIAICSDQFLFYLSPKMATTAYDEWSHMASLPISSLPPERFSFEVVNMSLQ